ncbi:MAG: YdcF family protein [Gemmatirosa sp.]
MPDRWRGGGGPRTGYRGTPASADGVGRRMLHGAVLTALLWIALARLGVHDVVGQPELLWLPLGVVIGAVLGWRGWLAPVWLLGALATVAVLVITTTPVMRPAVAALLPRDAHADAAGADAVFVLSAAVTKEGRVSGQGPERLLHGIALARAASLPLVVSVVRNRGRTSVSSLADQQALASLAGVAQLVTVDSVTSTRDEALRVATLARTRGWRTIAVVTSPLHARRACASVARAGLRVRCTPAPSRELSLNVARPLTGTEERARVFGLWLYETVAWWSYRARGWV